MMTGETRWWWVRHAPVAWAGVRIYGHTDLDCDVSDRAAFIGLAAGLPPGAVTVRSHLTRTLRTAQAIGFEPAVVEPDLAEQGFGAWEGESWDGLRAAGDPHLEAFWRAPFTVAPPGGESFVQVVERVRAVVERLSVLHARRDIVAVAHSGSIRAALAVALDLSPEKAHAVAVDNLSLTRIDHGSAGWSVRAVNLPPRAAPAAALRPPPP
ncbi:MAG: histidine phosphatase family protein [Alphaproteobacteria bacterium]